jgi:hypothetical protein
MKPLRRSSTSQYIKRMVTLPPLGTRKSVDASDQQGELFPALFGSAAKLGKAWARGENELSRRRREYLDDIFRAPCHERGFLIASAAILLRTPLLGAGIG